MMTLLRTTLLVSTLLGGTAFAAQDGGSFQTSKEWVASAPQTFEPPDLAAVPGDSAGCVVVGYYILRNGRVAKARVMEGAFTRGTSNEFQQSFADAAIVAAQRWTFAPARRGEEPMPAFEWAVFGYGPPAANGSRVVLGDWERQDRRVKDACRLQDLAAWGKKNAVPPGDVPDHARKVLFPVDEPADAFWTVDGLLTPPRYPRAALESGAEGCVIVGISVASNGVPEAFRIVDSDVSGPRRGRELLEQAALETASQWRFAPGPDNPGRMPAFIQIPTDFSIDDTPASRRCRFDDRRQQPAQTPG